MSKKVSIVTPVFNGEKYITRLINSIENQTYKNWEWIVVDDHSTDNTRRILRDFQEMHPDKVVILRTPRQKSGPSVGRNIGIENATGKYITIIDADDWWSPTFLEKTVENMKNVDAVTTGYYDVIENTGILIKSLPRKTGVISWRDVLQFKARLGQGSSLLRKDFIDEFKIRFPEKYRYTEDTFFYTQYISVIEKVYSIGTPEFYHLIRTGSLVRGRVPNPEVKIIHTVRVYDELCERVLPKISDKYKEVCELVNKHFKPYSIMTYIISISDTHGRKVTRELFLKYLKHLLHYRPNTTIPSLITLFWMMDMIIPIRKLVRSIIIGD